MKVAIANLSSGEIHVHSPECKDLKAAKYSRDGFEVIDMDSRQALVEHLFSGFEDLAEDGSNWEEFANNEGVRFMPCATL
jgi:hypothetical protein